MFLRRPMCGGMRQRPAAKLLMSMNLLFTIIVLLVPLINARQQGVKLRIEKKQVVIDNGILKLTISKPDGIVIGVHYNGIDNLLEIRNREINRGYWDLVWSINGTTGKTKLYDRMRCSSFNVIKEDDNQVEVSFTRTWSSRLQGIQVPLKIDKRFIMLRGKSGFYSYGIFEHVEGWPGFNLLQARIAMKLQKDMFHYMALTDKRQRIMPMPDDRQTPRGRPLAYPEAVLLVNPTNNSLKGEVDDKYQYSIENKDDNVHGWISTKPLTGFWHITPSQEFRSGGPLKQELSSHVLPIILSVFTSDHYAGNDMVMRINDNEPWKKVYGPVFFYLNSASSGTDQGLLWEDAKNQTLTEAQSWPYDFPVSNDFPKTNQRGSLAGQLFVKDRYISSETIPAKFGYIGLAAPGDNGSWQRQTKGYQFWAPIDNDGNFSITNIRSGTYNLYAWVPNFIGDYKYQDTIKVTEGGNIDLGNIVFETPRNGPTLWEIGVPDRSASEFYVPDPSPELANKLYINHTDKYRQYGLWDRYTDLYPRNDLVYTIESSDYHKDWYYAHVNRKIGNNKYKPSTWQIRFNLSCVNIGGTYMLRLAIASATYAELQVRFNKFNVSSPYFTTGQIGDDNAIARHGIHGLYWLFSVEVTGSMLVKGENVVFLTQTRSDSPFRGIMYDYIRLEAPMSSCPNSTT